MVEQLGKELKLISELAWGRRPTSTFERDIISCAGESEIPAMLSQSTSQPDFDTQELTAYTLPNLRAERVQNLGRSLRSYFHSQISSRSPQNLVSTRKYVELYANRGRHEICHAEVDVSNETVTDHDFFNKVKAEYHQIHKRRWFFEPNGVRFVEVGTSTSLSIALKSC